MSAIDRFDCIKIKLTFFFFFISTQIKLIFSFSGIGTGKANLISIIAFLCRYWEHGFSWCCKHANSTRMYFANVFDKEVRLWVARSLWKAKLERVNSFVYRISYEIEILCCQYQDFQFFN